MPEAARVATVTSRRPRAPHPLRQTGSPADDLLSERDCDTIYLIRTNVKKCLYIGDTKGYADRSEQTMKKLRLYFILDLYETIMDITSLETSRRTSARVGCQSIVDRKLSSRRLDRRHRSSEAQIQILNPR